MCDFSYPGSTNRLNGMPLIWNWVLTNLSHNNIVPYCQAQFLLRCSSERMHCLQKGETKYLKIHAIRSIIYVLQLGLNQGWMLSRAESWYFFSRILWFWLPLIKTIAYIFWKHESNLPTPHRPFSQNQSLRQIISIFWSSERTKCCIPNWPLTLTIFSFKICGIFTLTINPKNSQLLVITIIAKPWSFRCHSTDIYSRYNIQEYDSYIELISYKLGSMLLKGQRKA